jgi:REP element-mobilizing transposase RayT
MRITSQIAEVSALGYKSDVHKHLRRLERIWGDAPIFFVTTCTRHRKPLLACDDIAKVLIDEWCAAHDRHGWSVGGYIVMPDHVHFFCRPELHAKPLSEFVGFWKSYTSRRVHVLNQSRSAPAATTLWQREFFDHVLRSSESYSEKWNYVWDNPVRAGLVSNAGEWELCWRDRNADAVAAGADRGEMLRYAESRITRSMCV